MLRSSVSALVFTSLLFAVACDSKKDDKAAGKAEDKKAASKAEAKDAKGGEAKADAKAGEAKADEAKAGGEPAAAGGLAIDKLKLKADAPEGTTVGDGIGEGVMVQGPGLVAMVEVASDTRPKTEDDAKKDADMYSPKNLQSEKLADGWVVTFDNEGSAGKNFFVNVRRDIGGKAYWCETTAPSEEQAANAVAFCKSLKP